jgi:uncharacterized protein (TIGR02118 family)
MIVVLTWFRRRGDLSVADFRSYWRDEHPRAVLGLPGLRRYVQNPVTDQSYDGRRPWCDGVAQTWWDDVDALRAQRGTDELAAVMADEDEFLDPDSRGHVVAREVAIIDGSPPPGSLKQFSWLHHREDLDVAEAQRYWREDHARVAGRVPGLVRYVQCHTLVELFGRGHDPEHMGVPIAWLPDMEAARRAGASPELAATRADEANFLAPVPLPFVLTTEVEIDLG